MNLLTFNCRYRMTMKHYHLVRVVHGKHTPRNTTLFREVWVFKTPIQLSWWTILHVATLTPSIMMNCSHGSTNSNGRNKRKRIGEEICSVNTIVTAISPKNFRRFLFSPYTLQEKCFNMNVILFDMFWISADKIFWRTIRNPRISEFFISYFKLQPIQGGVNVQYSNMYRGWVSASPEKFAM